MVTLIRLELGKLVRKVSFFICLTFLLSFCVVNYGDRVNPFGSKLYLMDEDGAIRHGRDAIRLERVWMEPYRGVLTDARVEEIVQCMDLRSEQQKAYRQTIENRAWLGNVGVPYAERIVSYFFRTTELFSGEYLDNGQSMMNPMVVALDTPKQIGEVFPDSVLPLRLEYSLPWSGTMESMVYGLFVLNLFVLLIVSPVFSEEHMHRMNALLFTSRFGKRKCFCTKVIASYSLGAVLALAIILLHLLVTFMFFGGDGLAGSMQISDSSGLYRDLPYFKTVGSAILDSVLLYTADVIFAVSVTVFGSVLASHVLTGMVISLILWAAPIALSFVKMIPDQIRWIAPAAHRTDLKKVLSLPDVSFGNVDIPYSLIAAGILVLLSGLITLCAAGIYRHVTGE